MVVTNKFQPTHRPMNSVVTKQRNALIVTVLTLLSVALLSLSACSSNSGLKADSVEIREHRNVRL